MRTPTPLTDLDQVKVEWDAKGLTESVSVFLQNVDTNARTGKKAVLADVRSVTFRADDLHDVASNRKYRDKNRVRTVIEWSGQAVRSDIADNLVGIKYRLMIGGTLITPQGSPVDKYSFGTIDDSTEQMPRDYCFSVDFAGWSRSNAALKMEGRNSAGSFLVFLVSIAAVHGQRASGRTKQLLESDNRYFELEDAR